MSYGLLIIKIRFIFLNKLVKRKVKRAHCVLATCKPETLVTALFVCRGYSKYNSKCCVNRVHSIGMTIY